MSCMQFPNILPKTPLHKTTLDDEAALDFSQLPPFLRVLLVTDGVVTRTLEAYFGEPIDIVVLSHLELRSERCHPEIAVNVGDPIVSRRVLLRGRSTQHVYVLASSIVVMDLIPPEVRQRLTEDKKGIGELLSASRLETYREIISIRKYNEKECAGYFGVATRGCAVGRTYKIYLDKRAVILIEEVLPITRF